MIRPIHQGGPHVDERVTSQNTRFEGVADSLFDCGDEIPGDASARDLVDELEAFAGLGRLEINDRMAVLAFTT